MTDTRELPSVTTEGDEPELPAFRVEGVEYEYQPAVFFGKACGPMDEEHLVALLAALPAEQRERVLAKFDNRPPPRCLSCNRQLFTYCSVCEPRRR